ncbi:hypothetical protein B0919_01415 [Hymenobacter sp. CRA2]|nr:hypothetical protein B0919_01415 [Hymenobacter sp. CRA2]
MVRAQQRDPSFRPSEIFTTGQIKSAVPDGVGGLWVLGNFDYAAGSLVPGLAHYDATGQRDPAFQPPAIPAAMQRQLRALRALPNGRVLVLGDGTLTIGAVIGFNLMVLGPTGQPDPSFAPPDYFTAPGDPLAATAAVQPDSKVLVGGRFGPYNGTGPAGLVRLLANGQIDPGFTPPGNGISNVRALAVQPDGKILVGGSQLSYNNTLAPSGLLRLLPDGSLDTSFTPPAGLHVWELVLQRSGNVLIGAAATNQVAAGRAGSVVRLLPSGAADATFDPLSYPGRELALNGNQYWNYFDQHFAALTDGSVLVAYAPSLTGNESLVQHYTAAGQPDTTWDAAQPAAGGQINSVAALPSGLVALGGNFRSLAGRAGCLVALRGPAGRPVAAWRFGLGLTGTVRALARQTDGRLLIGGNFTEVNGWFSPQVARLWPSGEVDTTFQAPADGLGTGVLNTLALDASGRVLLGGRFQTVGGQPRVGVARLSSTGQLDAAFLPPALSGLSSAAEVQTLGLQPDGEVLLGGSFALTGPSTTRFHLIRLHDTGALDAGFTAAVPRSGQVGALLLQPTGEVVVGGNFYNNRLELIRRLRADGTLDPTFQTVLADPVMGGIVRALAPTAGGGLVAAGSFVRANNLVSINVARFNANGSTDGGFVSGLPTPSNPINLGRVNALALEPTGAVLLGGSLGNQAATQAPFMQRVLAAGPLDAAYFGAATPGPDGEVLTLLRQPDGVVLVGGSFLSVAGILQPALIRLLPAASTTAAQSAATVRAGLSVWPNPAGAAGLHVRLDAARPYRVQLVDAVGRIVLTQLVFQAETTLPTTALPAGVYLLRAEYATGQATRRVIIQ